MKSHQLLKPFAVGIIGAVIGASSTMFVSADHRRALAVHIAYAGDQDDQQRIVAAVKHVEPSVVALEVQSNGTRVIPANPFQNFFGRGFDFGFGNGGNAGQLTPFHEQASGSGFVYSDSGLIVTNDHVVRGATKIQVVFANGDRIAGHIYSQDPSADLALVKVDRYAKLPPAVQFASSRAVEKGEWAIAIGEPYALAQSVTVGVVSGFNRSETIGGRGLTTANDFKGLLQTSAQINPGNSGGPLIDFEGRVIGVNQSVERPAQGIGFAIPADTVKSTIAMLVRKPGSGMGKSSIGFLGVQLQALDRGLRTQLGYTGQGAAVAEVVGGSPADQAGLEPGDVIERVNGKPIQNPANVSSIVRAIKPGKTAALDVWESGTRKLVDVHIAPEPDRL